MGKYAPFRVNFVTFIVTVFGLPFCLTIWLYGARFIAKLFKYFDFNGDVIGIIIALILVVTFKYFWRLTVFLIMTLGLYYGSSKTHNQSIQWSSEFEERYTYDPFSFKPFFWRPKTVEEVAKAKLNKESWKKLKSERNSQELQKEKEFQDAVVRRAEELKARNN